MTKEDIKKEYQEILKLEDNEQYEEAFNRLKELADKGDSTAQYNLGYKYQLGVGIDQDKDKAMYYWKLSAKQGNEEAIGWLEFGFNIIVDKEEMSHD